MSDKIYSFSEYWNEIKKISYQPSKEILLFRGHRDISWELQPSVFRYKNEKDFERNVYHEVMIEYPEEFQNRSHLTNLVKMQHYKIPTRMLDFSRNPIIGLHFACTDEGSNGNDNRDGIVFVQKVKRQDILHHNSDRALMLSCLPCLSDGRKAELKEFCKKHNGRITEQYARDYNSAIHCFLHEIRGEYPGFECEISADDLMKGYYVAPFKDNERMKKQDGLFYIFGLDETPLKKDNNNTYKIIIDKNSKAEIMNDLELLGASKSDLYLEPVDTSEKM